MNGCFGHAGMSTLLQGNLKDHRISTDLASLSHDATHSSHEFQKHRLVVTQRHSVHAIVAHTTVLKLLLMITE